MRAHRCVNGSLHRRKGDMGIWVWVVWAFNLSRVMSSMVPLTAGLAYLHPPGRQPKHCEIPNEIQD
jgi:hypothetical protein